MDLFVKKIYRDLLKNKSRSLPILLLLIVSQMAAVIYIQVGIVVEASKDEYFEESQIGDMWIQTTEITSAKFNSTTLNSWNQQYSINAVETRLFFQGHLTYDNSRIPIDIISYPNDSYPSVNRFISEDGSYFSDHKNKNGVYIEQSYMKYYGIPSGDILNLNIDGFISKKLNVSIISGAYNPEYPMEKGPGMAQFELSSSFAQYIKMSIYVRSDFLQNELFNGTEVFNQICLKLEDKTQIDGFVQYLNQDINPLSNYIIDVDKYPKLIEDMVFLMVFVGWGVAIFFLFISIFLTYTMVNRFIAEQKPQIGIMKALGYSNSYILRRNLLYGFILSILGSTFGNILGIILGIGLTDFTLHAWLSIPTTVIEIGYSQCLFMIFITVFFSLLASYISSRGITQILPHAAIRPDVVDRSVKTIFFEKVLQKIFKIRITPIARYSIRNTLTNPKRTMTTIISLTMAIALIGGVFTVVTGVFAGSGAFFEYENWDAQISLSTPSQFQNIEVDINEKLSGHTYIMEPGLIDFAKINVNDKWNKLMYTALIDNPTLKVFNGFNSNLSVQISQDLADQLDIEPEKNYLVQGRNGTEIKVFIQEILPIHIVSSFYIPLSLGNLLTFGNDSANYVNQIYLSDSNLENENIVEINSIPGVNAILQEDIYKEINNWYQTISSVLFALLFLIIFIAAMIIFGIMSMSIAERKDDIMIMKAIGISNRSIYLYSGIEIVIYSIISSIGYFIGFYGSELYMGMLQSLMNNPKTTHELSLSFYLISILFGLLTGFIGQFLALKFAMKQSVAQATKEKMFA